MSCSVAIITRQRTVTRNRFFVNHEIILTKALFSIARAIWTLVNTLTLLTLVTFNDKKNESTVNSD
jgi:hypothetical protein